MQHLWLQNISMRHYFHFTDEETKTQSSHNLEVLGLCLRFNYLQIPGLWYHTRRESRRGGHHRKI